MGRISELVLILLVVMVLFGYKRLPDIGSSLGKAIREFQKAVKGEDEKKENEEKKPLA